MRPTRNSTPPSHSSVPTRSLLSKRLLRIGRRGGQFDVVRHVARQDQPAHRKEPRAATVRGVIGIPASNGSSHGSIFADRPTSRACRTVRFASTAFAASPLAASELATLGLRHRALRHRALRHRRHRRWERLGQAGQRPLRRTAGDRSGVCGTVQRRGRRRLLSREERGGVRRNRRGVRR